MKSMKYALGTWGDNTRIQPDSDLIEVATDGSLDEGNCILRTHAHGPSILSDGWEFFVQLDREEADALLSALEVCEDGGGDEDTADALARIAKRVRRMEQYRATEQDEVEAPPEVDPDE